MAVIKKPANFSRLFGKAEVNQLAKQFQVGESIEVINYIRQGRKELFSDIAQDTAKKAFLKVSTGNFVLKEFPWFVTSTTFPDAVLRLQTNLRERFGLPIPEYVSTVHDGKMYVSMDGLENLRIVTLQNLIVCTSWSGSPEQIRSSAHILRRLHLASGVMLSEGKITGIPTETVFDHTLSLLEVGYEEIIRDRISNFSEQEIEKLDHLVENYRKEILLAKESALSNEYLLIMIPVHGDFHQNNILFDSHGEVAGIVDFDNCCIDHPVNDVAKMILSFGFFNVSEGKHPFEKIPKQIATNSASDFLSAYLEDNIYAETIKNNLAATAKTVALQLAFLGILTGGYNSSRLEELDEMPGKIEGEMNSFMQMYHIRSNT